MNTDTMTREMLRTLPDLSKKRTRDTLYIFTGYKEKDGANIMADRSCSCGGRGFTGYDPKRKLYVRCSCVVIVNLPIEFVVLEKKKFRQKTV